jgi:hypothetical protein
MDIVTGAVVIAGMKHLGAPAAKVLTDFVGRVLAPSGDIVGKSLSDSVTEWQDRRAKRAEELLLEAAKRLRSNGMEAQPVPGRVLMPILHHASLEEEAFMRQRWVNLLAIAAAAPASIPLQNFL